MRMCLSFVAGIFVTSSAIAQPSEGKKQDWIAVSEQAVRAALKDGASASFRNEHFVTFRGIPLVCGEVTAKNGFGGYAGFQHFIAGGDTHFIEEQFSPGEFAGFWNQICAKK